MDAGGRLEGCSRGQGFWELRRAVSGIEGVKREDGVQADDALEPNVPSSVLMKPRTHQGHVSIQTTSATRSRLLVISTPIEPRSWPTPARRRRAEMGERGSLEGRAGMNGRELLARQRSGGGDYSRWRNCISPSHLTCTSSVWSSATAREFLAAFSCWRSWRLTSRRIPHSQLERPLPSSHHTISWLDRKGIRRVDRNDQLNLRFGRDWTRPLDLTIVQLHH